MGGSMRAFYEERRNRFGTASELEASRSRRLGWARITVFGVGFAAYVISDISSGAVAGWALGALGLALIAFVFLVVWHRRVRGRERWLRALTEVNRVVLARLDRDWKALPRTPETSTEADHPYAQDLDVCGDASLLRLLTTVTVPPGQATLREWLLKPAPWEEVLLRQEAVRELAPQVDLRQRFEVTGRLLDPPDSPSLEEFLSWAEEEPWLPRHPWIRVGALVLPVLSAGLMVMYLRGPLHGPWWLFSLAAAFALASTHRRRIHSLMDAASGGQERFGRYAALMALFLETEAEAPILRTLRGRVSSGNHGAPTELRRLGRLVGWADVRLSGMAHGPLQALLAWDIHVLGALERWKRRAGPHVRNWLGGLGELEALLALAALSADHPDWCFPVMTSSGDPTVRARGLGHPLLPPSTCVCNDVEVGPPGSFLFVTGSNMSGKSTLLRAIGINSVLAQAGAPVCAREMTLTPLAVQTSMRTADSLSEGVSQYMAELKRIQRVVKGARDANGVLYLLDEPLQGTNEAERRVANRTILGHLLQAGAIGAVATHDLQLDGTPRLEKAARAVHLEGQVREGETGPLLTFDYRLRPGRATSTNALALLRAVGLGEVEG
jgi:hypothetical protein